MRLPLCLLLAAQLSAVVSQSFSPFSFLHTLIRTVQKARKLSLFQQPQTKLGVETDSSAGESSVSGAGS